MLKLTDAYPYSKWHRYFSKHLGYGFHERLLLLFANLVSGFDQSGYGVGGGEMQANSTGLIFHKLPELHSKKGNFLINPFKK